MDSYFFMAQTHGLTRGRKPRKRAPGAGSAVAVKGHKRTPRGPNRGKKAVIVGGYKRGKPKKQKN